MRWAVVAVTALMMTVTARWTTEAASPPAPNIAEINYFTTMTLTNNQTVPLLPLVGVPVYAYSNGVVYTTPPTNNVYVQPLYYHAVWARFRIDNAGTNNGSGYIILSDRNITNDGTTVLSRITSKVFSNQAGGIVGQTNSIAVVLGAGDSGWGTTTTGTNGWFILVTPEMEDATPHYVAAYTNTTTATTISILAKLRAVKGN